MYFQLDLEKQQGESSVKDINLRTPSFTVLLASSYTNYVPYLSA